jgi:hypothetical protein
MLKVTHGGFTGRRTHLTPDGSFHTLCGARAFGVILLPDGVKPRDRASCKRCVQAAKDRRLS